MQLQPASTGKNQEKVDGRSATWFKPGISPNPAGRPKGSRNKLGEHLIVALTEDFEEHGKAAIIKVREEDPSTYLKVIAQIVPKELIVRPVNAEEMSEDDILELVAATADIVTVSSVEGSDHPEPSSSGPELPAQRALEAPRKEKPRK